MKFREHCCAVGSQVAGQPLRVDREAGLLRNVRVLGLKSRNNRRYLPEAVRDAAGLYEGRKVYKDHERDGRERRTDDFLGVLKNVRYVEGEGLFGDVKVRKRHPFAEQLFEIAEEFPGELGFSHDAEGDTYTERGELVVSRIAEVNSVDLVTEPATTRGLFESRSHPVKTTVREIFGHVVKHHKSERVREGLKKFLENAQMGYGDEMEREQIVEQDPEAEEPVDVGAAVEEDPDQAMIEGFASMVNALVRNAVTGDSEAMKKIQTLIKTAQKLTKGGGSGAVSEMETDDEKPVADEEEEDRPVPESWTAEKKVTRALELLQESEVPADAVLVESLVYCPDEAAMKKIVGREAKRLAESAKKDEPAVPTSRPRWRLSESGREQTNGHDEFTLDYLLGA